MTSCKEKKRLIDVHLNGGRPRLIEFVAVLKTVAETNRESSCQCREATLFASSNYFDEYLFNVRVYLS